MGKTSANAARVFTGWDALSRGVSRATLPRRVAARLEAAAPRCARRRRRRRGRRRSADRAGACRDALHLSPIQQLFAGEMLNDSGVREARHERRNRPPRLHRATRSGQTPRATPIENGKCRTMAFSIDSSTLEHAANGDPAPLRTLVTILKPRIEKQLLRYPLAEEDRRDLAQATLMQVIRRVGSFRGDSSFSTWLFRVTANEALMMMRSQRRHRARLVEGLDLEDLGSLPAANDAAGDQRAEATRGRKRARRARPPGARGAARGLPRRGRPPLPPGPRPPRDRRAPLDDRERRPLAPAPRPLAPPRHPRARQLGHEIAAA